jgi:hypothetical protein
MDTNTGAILRGGLTNHKEGMMKTILDSWSIGHQVSVKQDVETEAYYLVFGKTSYECLGRDAAETAFYTIIAAINKATK